MYNFFLTKRVAGLHMFLLYIWLLRIFMLFRNACSENWNSKYQPIKYLRHIKSIFGHHWFKLAIKNCCDKKLKLKLSICILNQVLFSMFCTYPGLTPLVNDKVNIWHAFYKIIRIIQLTQQHFILLRKHKEYAVSKTDKGFVNVCSKYFQILYVDCAV